MGGPNRGVFDEQISAVPFLHASDLTVRLGGKTIVDGVSLELQRGKLTAIVGPNGSGKTTLLRALTGELPLAGGSVTIDGQPVINHTRAPKATARWRAVLPQNSNLAFGFSVLQVVLMGRAPHSKSSNPERDHQIAREALVRVDCIHLADRLFPTLSGGEKQRVQAARVLAQLHEALENGTPCLLFLDEPTNHLDPGHQFALLSVAREVTQAGAATLLILHDLPQTRIVADDVVILDNGRTAASGPPAVALTPGIIETVFHIRSKLVEIEGAEHLVLLGECAQP